MIHLIKNTNGTFDVAITGDNHEVLHHSKQGFERKAGAHNHIISLAEQLGNDDGTIFQDDTAEKLMLLYVNNHCDVFGADGKIKARYIAKRAR